jgi:hypothetical protein
MDGEVKMTTNDVLTDCCTIPASENEPQAGPSTLESPSTVRSDDTSTVALDELRKQTTTPEAAAIRAATFRLLLDEGQPVTTADLEVETGFDDSVIAEVIERGAGRVELDAQGNIVGIAGLTIYPTRHQLTIGTRTRWTWCALDAIGILGALEATGAIRSTDPRSGHAIEIDFVEGNPQGDAALFILGGYDGGNVREEWCPLVNFFTTHGEAEAWVAAHDLNGEIVSVVQVAEEAAAMWRPVTDPSRSNPTQGAVTQRRTT